MLDLKESSLVTDHLKNYMVSVFCKLPAFLYVFLKDGLGENRNTYFIVIHRLLIC